MGVLCGDTLFAEGKKNMAAVTVDNGRHGEDDAIAVVDDGVGRLVLDDVQVVFEVTVRLQTVQNQTGPLEDKQVLATAATLL